MSTISQMEKTISAIDLVLDDMKDYLDPRWKCLKCNKPTDNDGGWCDNCRSKCEHKHTEIIDDGINPNVIWEECYDCGEEVNYELG